MLSFEIVQWKVGFYRERTEHKCLSVCLSKHLFVCLNICLCVRTSVCVSEHLSVCRNICLCVFEIPPTPEGRGKGPRRGPFREYEILVNYIFLKIMDLESVPKRTYFFTALCADYIADARRQAVC